MSWEGLVGNGNTGSRGVGIGKSTLLTQVAFGSAQRKVLRA